MHLGRNASVFQQHSGPHSWVSGHEPPVAADLGGFQEGFGVQVGKDAEERCTHLQDLWTYHLIGFRWALFMAARLAVNHIRPTCSNNTAFQTFNSLKKVSIALEIDPILLLQNNRLTQRSIMLIKTEIIVNLQRQGRTLLTAHYSGRLKQQKNCLI